MEIPPLITIKKIKIGLDYKTHGYCEEIRNRKFISKLIENCMLLNNVKMVNVDGFKCINKTINIFSVTRMVIFHCI